MVPETQLDLCISALHDSVYLKPLEAFKEVALPLLRGPIPFDAGIWATGGADDGRIHSVATSGFPLNALLDYAGRWQEQDFVRAAATASPGRAFRNEDVMPLADYHRTPIYREYSRPAGIEHALAVALVDPITRVGELVFLFRRAGSAFFTDAECRALERVAPHMESAWRHRQMLHSYERYRVAPHELAGRRIARSVVDADGRIHASEPAFGLALREAFPDWSGPLVPPALIGLVRGAELCLDAANLRLILYRGDTRHLLVAAPRDFATPLTAAELRVALGCAAGKTTSALATELNLSSRTVRNQLTAVYQKLDVHSRAELATRVRQLWAEPM